ncbi:MAG: sialidase family protein [Candidatus Hodarchaeota archaeon]
MNKSSSLFLLFVFLLCSQPLTLPASFLLLQQGTSLTSMGPRSFQAPIQAGDVRFGRNVDVIDGSSPYPEQVEPTLTVLSTGRILIGWKEANTATGPGLRVGFCYTNDEGQSFSPNILMEPLAVGGHQSDPWLVSDHLDNAYFAFLEYNFGEGMGVAKSIDGGVTWQSPTQASDTEGYLDDKETVCVDGAGNIYMMWDHFYTSDNAHLVFTKSTNGGASFQATQVLGEWEDRGGIPYITCTPNGTLYASTWDSFPSAPDAIYITKSTDYGTSWSSPHQVNIWGYEDIALITVCATDSNHDVYICFAAGTSTNREVYVTKSTDGGTSWSTPVQVNEETNGMQRMVEMYIDDDDTIHVAWLDAQNNEWDIYYSYSDDGGVSFSSNVRITSEGFPLSFSRPGDYFTLRDGPTGKLYIVWTDGRKETDQDIFFAKQDVAAPEITHDPPTSASHNTPFTIAAMVTDDDYIDRVELTYQYGEEPDQIVQMLEVPNDIYLYTIPASHMTGNSIAYWFTAYDEAGRTTRLPGTISGKFAVPINPVSPMMTIVIVASIIVIVIVLVFAIWYLRHPVSQ